MIDRLGVLTSTRYVVERPRHVHIDEKRLQAVCAEVAATGISVPVWNKELHWADGPEQTAMYVFVLDSLNFCFWGEPRWRIVYKGQTLDGYWGLAASLRRAVEENVPILDAAYLAEMPERDLARVLRGTTTIPMFAERLAHLHELGAWLARKHQGQCSRLIQAAGGDAVALVQRVASELPSFNDVTFYDGQVVRLFKRAQILAGDLAGSLNGQGLGALRALDELTAFADYKLPQILRRFGVLVYEPELARQIDSRELLPANSAEEVEIRCHTVWAVEMMRRQLERQGLSYAAYQIDWWLWETSQRLPADVQPYHRTRTIYY